MAVHVNVPMEMLDISACAHLVIQVHVVKQVRFVDDSCRFSMTTENVTNLIVFFKGMYVHQTHV